MSYDQSQFEEISNRLANLKPIDINEAISPALQNLLDSIGDMQTFSIVHASQEYLKTLKIQFPKIFSLDISNEALIELSKHLTASIPSVTSENLANSILSLPSCNIDVKRLQAAMTESISSVVKAAGELNMSSDDTDEDFITADEDSIKEWNIPDTIAIPIGHHRIRMRTDIFITILSSIVIPILFGIAGQIVDLNEAYINAKTETKRIEVEQERNNLIRENNRLLGQCLDLLNSTDASNSSEFDQIESWKEGLPEVVSDPSASGSVPDQTQGTQNNSLE